MNIILFSDQDCFRRDHLRLSDRRFDHLKSVNRVNVGDRLVIGEINGKIGTGLVSKIGQNSIELEIVSLNIEPPAPLPLNLIMALPRPKMIRRIIQSVTSLGVKKLYFINSWRVEKSFWKAPVLEASKIERHALLGLEQSRDTILPDICFERLFSPFVHSKLSRIDRDTTRLVAHPYTPEPFPNSIEGDVTLVIGPEGGFIQREIQTFEEMGYSICHMGQRILRVETAAIALPAKLFL